MPLILRPYSDRHTLRAKPEWLFAFGDNLQRRGKGGQAAQMRGEPNAVGLVTKREPSMHPRAFFINSDLDLVKHHNRQALEQLIHQIKSGGTVIWPANGIGTGLAQLDTYAPLILSYYQSMRKELENLGEIGGI